MWKLFGGCIYNLDSLQWINIKYKNLKCVMWRNVTREVNFVLYVMDLPCVGVSCRVWTELGVDNELRGVSSCDFSQGVFWVKVVDPLFIDVQVGMFK